MPARHAYRKLSIALATLTATLAIGVVPAHAQPAPPPPPTTRPAREAPGQGRQRPDRAENVQPVALSGTFLDFNLGPRGEPEGLMLTVEGNRTAQVNVPPPIAAVIAASMKTGQAVTLMAEPRLSLPDHPVYELVSMKVGDQEVRATRPEDAKPGHVDGVVKRVNYTRDGRPNGAVLESGDFVRVTPEAGEKLKLATGLKLAIEGRPVPMVGGKSMIDATSVNGVASTPQRDGPVARGPREGRRGPGGQGGQGGPGGQDGPPRPGAGNGTPND